MHVLRVFLCIFYIKKGIWYVSKRAWIRFWYASKPVPPCHGIQECELSSASIKARNLKHFLCTGPDTFQSSCFSFGKFPGRGLQPSGPHKGPPLRLVCNILIWGGLFYLRLGLFYLRLVSVTYGGLFCLRLKFGLVFFAYGGKSVWSFLLTVPLVQKNGFGLFYLRFPYCKQKRRTVSKKTSTVSKKEASYLRDFLCEENR